MTGVYDMMHKLKKALPWWVMVLVLAVGAMDLRADENPLMEATQHTQVCLLTSFMQQVKDEEHQQDCRHVDKGARGILAGMLQAGGTFYLLVDGDHKWWVTDTNHWRIYKGEVR